MAVDGGPHPGLRDRDQGPAQGHAGPSVPSSLNTSVSRQGSTRRFEAMTLAPPRTASASFDDTRDMNYIKPRGRRLSEYEAVICYSHPDMNTGWDGGDWTFR